MNKTITNKKYEEFWNNEELDIKTDAVNDDKKVKKPRKKSVNNKKINEQSEIIKEDIVIINQIIDIQPTIEPFKEILFDNKNLKEIYEQYVIDDKPYKIYVRGQLIFDNVNHKDNPVFYDDYLILFGNKYIYKGIRFEKY